MLQLLDFGLVVLSIRRFDSRFYSILNRIPTDAVLYNYMIILFWLIFRMLQLLNSSMVNTFFYAAILISARLNRWL